MAEIQTIIKTKTGLSTSWSSINPVLAKGEYGLETDTNKTKCGDGVTAWNDLPYDTDFRIADQDINDWNNAKSEIDNHITNHPAGISAGDQAKVDKIIINGDGSRYLADDGSYKAVSGGGGTVDETNIVHKDGTETITGVKTFTNGLALGNVIRPYYVETTNDYGTAGYCKFVEVTLTALGQSAGMSCEYYTLSSGAATGERFTVNLIVSQRSAMGTNPSCSFWATSLNGGFDGARFMLVISETSATKTVVQIYTKNTDINQNFRIIPNHVSNPDAIKFLNGEPIIQTLPAGAKLFCATTSLVGQEVIVGNKQVIGGSGQVYTDNLYERTAGKGISVNGFNLYALKDNLSALCQGRLTLQSAVAIPITDLTAQSTIYFTPCGGNKISLYDGTNWITKNFSEIPIVLSGLTSGKNYDVFAYDNNGTISLELSSAWADEVTRTDELTLQDGAYVKSTDKTRLYLGSFRATSATTTEDSALKRFVYNYYNKVPRSLFKIISSTTWTYGTSAWVWRYANNDSTNKVEILDGIGGSLADVSTSLQIQAVSGSFGYVSIGFNSGSANGSSAGSSVTGGFTQPSARLVKALNKGVNYFSTLETASSATPVTFSSSNMCRMAGVVTM